jgi:hypothetical protein
VYGHGFGQRLVGGIAAVTHGDRAAILLVDQISDKDIGILSRRLDQFGVGTFIATSIFPTGSRAVGEIAKATIKET